MGSLVHREMTQLGDVTHDTAFAFDRDGPTRVRLAGTPPLGQLPLLWREGLPASVIAAHEQSGEADLAAYSIPDAILIDRGWVVANGSPLYAPDLLPVYVRYYLRHGWTSPNLSPDGRERIAIERCWSIWHFNCATYGHWLLEGLPKLLTIRLCLAAHPTLRDVPVALPSNVVASVRQAIELLVPELATLYYDPDRQYIAAERMLLPTWGPDYFYHPAISELLDDVVARVSASARSDRIFVSRRNHSGDRVLRNADALARVAEKQGFAIVHPDEYAFSDQVAIFAGARAVVGEFSSALHNTIFSRRGAGVLALNWVNPLQSRIGRLRGLRIGYLLGTDGLPVPYRRERSEPLSYDICERTFAERTEQLLHAVTTETG